MKSPKKNIVLCADGTGNSGGVGKDTNVWRLYNAVDVNNKDINQIAFHDDGVGTNKNVVMKAMGLAFGLGLSKNIRELYKNAVMQYDEGAQLYLFGFSRGAHTIRLLAEMICTFGILKRKSFENERQLDEAIQQVHSKFKSAIRRAWLIKVISIFSHSSQQKLSEKTQRSIRQKINSQRIKLNDLLGLSVDQDVTDHIYADVKIKFVGVWDTVSAMGMPIDELRNNIFFAGHAFVDNKLHPNVEHGRQALAIDEMRQTFKPELWHQCLDSNPDEDIEQVWFSGVHSNVGGGYPKDELSLPALSWMVEEAKKFGLKFIADTEREIEQAANPNGTMYNSRAGVANIYRFKPRNIDLLTLESINSGCTVPKVHESVFKRITDSPAEYSPFNLSSHPGVSRDDQEEDPQSTKLKDKAWNIVWWQRILHFVFLILAIGTFVVGYMFTARYTSSGDVLTADHDVYFVSLFQKALIILSRENVFYVSKYIFPGYVDNLIVLGIFLSLIVSLLVYRSFLTAHLNNIGNIFWNKAPFDNNRVAAKEVNIDIVHRFIFGLARLFRSSHYLNQTLLPFLKHSIVPASTTVMFFALLFYVIKYLFVINLCWIVYLEGLLLIMFPGILFLSFVRVMNSLSMHYVVTDLLALKLPGKNQLNRMFWLSYDLDYVARLWGVIATKENAVKSEKKILLFDLVFPLVYATGFLLPLLYFRQRVNLPTSFENLLLPLVIVVLADWLENTLHIHQFSRFSQRGKASLSPLLIAISSVATRVKITFFVINCLILFALILYTWAQV